MPCPDEAPVRCVVPFDCDGGPCAALDGSGRGNHAMIRPPAERAEGLAGGAVRGGPAPAVSPWPPRISAPTDAFPTGDAPVTLEAWVFWEDARTANLHALLGYGGDADGEARGIGLNYAQIQWKSGTLGCSRGAQFNDGAWHHVAASYEGGTVRLFTDGAAVHTCQFGPLATPAGTDFEIGGYRTPQGYSYPPFGGRIDEVRVSDRALGAEEIASHAAAGAGLPVTAGTVGLWRFDEAAVVRCCAEGSECLPDGSCGPPDQPGPCPPGMSACDPLGCCPDGARCADDGGCVSDDQPEVFCADGTPCGDHCCPPLTFCAPAGCERAEPVAAACPPALPQRCEDVVTCCPEAAACEVVEGATTCRLDADPEPIEDDPGPPAGDEGLFCAHDQVAVAADACCPTDAPQHCDGLCCPPDATCEARGCGCPGGWEACGEQCCGVHTVCRDGECAPVCDTPGFPVSCGDVCCGSEAPCVDGECRCPGHHPVDCATSCCLEGALCDVSTCRCPAGRTECGPLCCAPGETCVDGERCVRPSGGGGGSCTPGHHWEAGCGRCCLDGWICCGGGRCAPSGMCG